MLRNLSKDISKDFALSGAAKTQSDTALRQRYFLFDSFYRPDSVTALGSAETNNTAYTLAQASGVTVWGISDNQACVISGTAGRAVAVQETNESDVIVEADVNCIGDSNGLAFRYTDINNFVLVVLAPTFLQIIKYVAGTSTTLATINKTYGAGRLSVLAKGKKIEVYLDGFLQVRLFDSDNLTATQHGLYTRAENTTYRWENLAIRPIGQVPFSIKDGFENASLSWFWTAESPNQSYSQTFSTAIKKDGNQSFRVELRKTDLEVNGSKRCEIALPAESPLEEHWYGCSIYLPEGGTEDYAFDPEPEILLQWHGMPDVGEQNVSPPLALLTKNGQWRIEQFWDPNRQSIQTTDSFSGGFYGQDIGPYAPDKGEWTDWVFHVRWGYSEAHQPITEVYKNGILVFERNGLPNCLNDASGVFGKMGIYKWVWKDPATTSTTTSRVVYYDDYFVR